MKNKVKINKKFFLISFIFISSNAFAQFSNRIQTCDTLASHGSSYASDCARLVAGRFLSLSADNVCNESARLGNNSSAVACIRASVGQDFIQEGTFVCKTIASLGSSYVSDCMSAIAGKMLDLRMINSCQNAASLGNSSQAVACVRNLVIGELPPGGGDWNPNPAPEPICQPTYRDQEILRSLGIIREMVYRQDLQQILNMVERIEQLVTTDGHLPRPPRPPRPPR